MADFVPHRVGGNIVGDVRATGGRRSTATAAALPHRQSVQLQEVSLRQAGPGAGTERIRFPLQEHDAAPDAAVGVFLQGVDETFQDDGERVAVHRHLERLFLPYGYGAQAAVLGDVGGGTVNYPLVQGGAAVPA